MSTSRDHVGMPGDGPQRTLGTCAAYEMQSAMNKSIDYLMGKVLTQIEASTPDKEQREALKSVIKNVFYSFSDDHIRGLVVQLEEQLEHFLGHKDLSLEPGGWHNWSNSVPVLKFLDSSYGYSNRRGDVVVHGPDSKIAQVGELVGPVSSTPNNVSTKKHK